MHSPLLAVMRRNDGYWVCYDLGDTHIPYPIRQQPAVDYMLYHQLSSRSPLFFATLMNEGHMCQLLCMQVSLQGLNLYLIQVV